MTAGNEQLMRRELESQFGQERSRKFLLTLHDVASTKGRLLAWQDDMIDQLCTHLQIAKLSFSDVKKIFNYCYLHKVDLQQDRVPITYGTEAPPDRAEVEFALNTFPHAREAAFGPCWVENETHRAVFFCPDCRQALAEHRTRGTRT